jgi:hypothetical protein
MSDAAYRVDFFTWANTQADAVRRRSANELDWDNIAEELEGLARQDAWELYNRFVVLVTHLLKWRHQADWRGPSWETTIRVQRKDIAKLLKRSPGLKSVQAEDFLDAFDRARLSAAEEMKRDPRTLPTEAPFTVEQALDPNYWPEAVEG